MRTPDPGGARMDPGGAPPRPDAAPAADSARARLVRGYYLATPLFLVADLTFGWNVRVAGLAGAPLARVLYYLLCVGLGAFAWMKPERADLVGLLESGVNLALLIVGTYAAYWGMVDLVLADHPIVNPFTTERLANLILSGTVLSISFYGNPLLRGARRL